MFEKKAQRHIETDGRPAPRTGVWRGSPGESGYEMPMKRNISTSVGNKKDRRSAVSETQEHSRFLG